VFPVLGGLCSGYVLLDTAINFFSPCAASKDISAHIEKLHSFQNELQDVLDKSKHCLEFLRYKADGLEEKQRVNNFQKLLIGLKKQHCEQIAMYQRYLSKSMQQHESIMEKERREHKERLEAERQNFEALLLQEKELHKRNQEEQKKFYDDYIAKCMEEFKGLLTSTK